MTVYHTRTRGSIVGRLRHFFFSDSHEMGMKIVSVLFLEKIQEDMNKYPGDSVEKSEDISNFEVYKCTPTEIVDILDDILEKVDLSKKNNSHEPRMTNSKIYLNLIGGGEDKRVICLDNEPDSEEEEDENEGVTVKEESTANANIVNTKNSLFTMKQWGEDEDSSDPAGINYK